MRRAYTLIEVTVVVAVLLLLAAVVMPNLAANQRGREHREFFAAARRLVATAQSRAVSERTTFSIGWDDGGNALVLLPAEEGADPVQEVVAPDGIRPQEFRVDGQTVGSADFQVRCFADGKCEGGGIEFSDEGERASLVIDRLGNGRFTDEGLPDPAAERWEAGEMERRA